MSKKPNKQRAKCHPARAHEAYGFCRQCYKRRPDVAKRARAYTQNYRERFPEKFTKELIKDRTLRYTYGITLEDYNALLEVQGGGCAICGRLNSCEGRSLAVDHNHKTEAIRGLLCVFCNTSVGLIERVGLGNLSRIVDYICNDPSRKVS